VQRRDILAALIAMPSLALEGIRATVATASEAVRQTIRRVRPSDPDWPGTSRWAKLKEDVGGHLIEPKSLFGACPADPNGSACLDAHKNLANPFWIGDQPAGTQVSGWLDAWTPETSVYAIKARNTADVVAGVNFARENNLRLVVKGAGHSYLGTSNAPDSLLIWTRTMNQVTLHDAFVGQGCEGQSAPVPAVSAGAGAVWIDLYSAVTVRGGRYVQGGGCADVGVAGLVQSGGFGSFSRGFGTAAAGLLEAEIVTADGRVRIVNACRDADLFWAIKGGGGGTYGVVTRLTLRTHELPALLGAAWGMIKAQSDVAFTHLIAHFLSFCQEQLVDPHWGEQISLRPDNTLEISMVSQGLSTEQMNALWQPFIRWVNASPTEFVVITPLGFHAGNPRTWWEVEGNPSMIPDSREGAPKDHGWWQGDQDQVGVLLHGFESLWLPASLLEQDRRGHFTEALFAASRHKRVQLHLNKGLAGAPQDVLEAVRQTATNPVVTKAFALAIIADGEAPAYSGLSRTIDLAAARQDARAIDRSIAELRKVVPNAGSYVSESNYFNRKWQNAYWGTNYSRLRGIKAHYDPDGLFFVHHGVGSEDWSADGFTRRG
jgi:FAD/FMN-containing dehydrogenase